MKITYLNGKRFNRAIKAASLWISKNQQKLNDINVFPVPDSDTGTNMVSTMNSIAEGINLDGDEPIGNVSHSIAESALNGARGNSGAILAQFFQGLSEGLKGKVKITTQNFSEAVAKAVERSYEALANPKEGTILTVIKDWGDHIKEFSQKTHDFTELMHTSLQAAYKSLEETPKKLKMLAKSGVVDAGGLGFVYIIEGVTDFIKNGTIKSIKKRAIESDPSLTNAANIDFSLDQITYRYCTEFYLVGENIPAQLLRDELQPFGDSLIVAGSESRVRVHIHTDDPREVFDFVRQYGEILEQKIDDMHQQHTDAHDSVKRKEIALVTDSSCDLPREIIKKYNIHVVPLRLFLDEIEYIDKVTLQPEEFYARFKAAKSFPKTSQPTPKDFLRLYQQLSKHYKTIISVNLSSALSGTFQSALTAAKQLPDSEIHVIDSKTLSVSLGLILEACGEAIHNGITADELMTHIHYWIENNKIIVSISTLKYLIKGGRVTKSKGWIAKLLKMVPILAVDSTGKAEKIGVAKPGLSSQKKVLDKIVETAKTMKRPRFAIVHVEARETAEWYREQLKSLFHQKDISILPVAPVLGAHAGPGAAAVAILDTKF